jgi:hypothetical protein
MRRVIEMFGKQALRIGASLMAIVLASAGSAIADQGAQTGLGRDQCQIRARASEVPEGDSSPGARRRNGGPGFSATQIVDVDFQVRFAPRNGDDHLLSVRVFTPRDHLYQQIDVPFSAQIPAGSKSTRRIEGYPRPVVLQKTQEVEETGSNANKGQRRHQVMARLPVAGTLIMQNSLYGDWTAEAFLDGGDRCGTITFEIHE